MGSKHTSLPTRTRLAGVHLGCNPWRRMRRKPQRPGVTHGSTHLLNVKLFGTAAQVLQDD